MKSLLRPLILFAGIAVFFSPQLLCAQAEQPAVRVAILQEVPSVRLSVPVPCRLKNAATGTVLGEYPELRWQEVHAGPKGLRIGELELDAEAVLVEPLQEAKIRVNAKAYRGSFLLLRTSSGALTVINLVDLEEYLVGALASEANAGWPIEALKAHAVVSRTAVAHRMWISRDKPFDVTADSRTHVYYGVSAEREGTRRAVAATKGEVLAYDNELLSAVFHANCGGHTEDVAELWEIRGDPVPLRGVPDPYCRGMRHFTWKLFMGALELTKVLGDESRSMGTIQSCQVLDRNRSGRVRHVRFSGERGSIEVTGKRLRELLGANRLRSLNFSVVGSNFAGFSFAGFGWGHGVGFCQWGAYGMARQGKKMDEILSFYFLGAQRRKLQGLPGFS